jgi:hypothetical protein
MILNLKILLIKWDVKVYHLYCEKKEVPRFSSQKTKLILSVTDLLQGVNNFWY